MLSILVCSVKPYLLEQLQKNIEQTIGIEYELLVHDNRKVQKGLCAVYNLLAAKAKYDTLCFVHEDVLFTTANWGVILQRIFLSDRTIGAVGIAGSKYKSTMFSGWFTGQKELDCAHIVHRYSYGDETITLKPDKNSLLEEVVCLDGVFICSTKKVWSSIKFDELHLTGFHLYDLDFSLRASNICRIMVTYEIELIHITHGGDFGDNWISASMAFHQRLRNALPFIKLVNGSAKMELEIAKVSLDVLKSYKISWGNKLKWITIQKLHMFPALYYAISKFLLYQPLQLKRIHHLFRSHE